jgi:translation initiation factor eIF-2B subunit delta
LVVLYLLFTKLAFRHDHVGPVRLHGTTTYAHPAVREAGRLFATTWESGNVRCRTMLRALQAAIRDCPPPPHDRDVRHHATQFVFNPSFTYWTKECRPHSVSMGNAYSFVKTVAATALHRDMPWTECQAILQESMEQYIHERIDFADLAIAKVAADKLTDGDVLLTYGNYEAIQVVLLEAHNNNSHIRFRVIVVDSKPLLEGKRMLRKLREAGIDCTYILLNALSYVMKHVTKILLGAEALLNDGSAYSRVGTACVALAAQDRIPVLVCAETYKITNRVQLEAITNNELGNPEHVVPGELNENLRVINLLYDLTPASMISGIVTEMGLLPPSSVAVLLREMNPQEAATGDF